MSSPFKPLAPFQPRVIEISYAAFAPDCDQADEPSPGPSLCVFDGDGNPIPCGSTIESSATTEESFNINLELVNCGLSPLVISNVTLTGNGYTLVSAPIGNWINPNEFGYFPYSPNQLIIGFPTSHVVGEYVGQIVIESNDPNGPCVIYLNGEVTEPLPPCVSPTITLQPLTYSDMNINPGSHTEVVSATGDAPLSYQWQMALATIYSYIPRIYSVAGPWVNVSDQDVFTFTGNTTDSLLVSFTGTPTVHLVWAFRCVVTNDCGVVNSAEGYMQWTQPD